MRAVALILCSCSLAHGFVPSAPGAALASRAALTSRPTTPALASRPVAALRAPVLCMAEEPPQPQGKLPFLLDPGTKGGIVVYTILLIVAPFIAYGFMLDNLGWDVITAGNVILVGYVGTITVAWTASYVFRVANKDMTYAQQLRDYENAVIQKRFEELSEEEVGALMGEIYPEKPGGGPGAPPE